MPDKPFSSETNNNNTLINPYETEDLNPYRGNNDIVLSPYQGNPMIILMKIYSKKLEIIKYLNNNLI